MTKKLLLLTCLCIGGLSFGQSEWTATDYSYSIVPTKFIEHKDKLYAISWFSIFGKPFKFENDSWVALNTTGTVGEPQSLLDAGDTLLYHTVQVSPKVSRTYYSLDEGESFHLLREKNRLMYIDSYYDGVTYYIDEDATCKTVGDSCYALGGRSEIDGDPIIGYKGPVTVVGDSLYLLAGGTVMHVSGDGGETFVQNSTNLGNYTVQSATNFRQIYDASTATFYLAAHQKNTNNLVAGLLSSKDHGRTWTEHFFTDELKSIDVAYNENLTRWIYSFDVKGDVIALGYTRNAPKTRADVLTSFTGFGNVKIDTLGFAERTKFESEGVYPAAFKIFDGKIFVSVSDGKVYTKDVNGEVNGLHSEKNQNDIQLFPNPTKGKITVSNSAFQGELVLSLYSIDGVLIKKNILNGDISFPYEIDVPKGIYLLKIANRKNEETLLKVVKE